MAKERLDLHLDREGEWLPGQPAHLKSHKAVSLGGRDVRILETECSGAALLSAAGAPVLGEGEADLYVKLTYASGAFEYLETPLRAPREFKRVRELELSILCVVGHEAWTRVSYRAFFNAHCVFETL